nr:2-oxoglutarate dehydrogenase, E2 component, dihydrolipoamide succinyltransferase [Propionibacteriales bacterium]
NESDSDAAADANESDSDAAADVDADAASGDSSQGDQPSEEPSDDTSDEGATDAPPSEQAPAAEADAKPSGGGDATDVTLPALGESVTEGTVTQWLKSVGDEVAVDEPLLEVSTDKVDTEIPSPVAGTVQEILVEEDETVEVGTVLARVGAGAPSGDSGSESGSAAKTPDSQSQSDPDSDSQSESQAESKSDTQETPEAPESSDAAATSTGDGADSADDVSANDDPVGQTDAGEVPAAEDKEEEPTAEKTSDVRAAASGDSESKNYVTPLVRKLASQHGVDLAVLTGTGVGGRIRKQDVLEAAETAKQEAESGQQDKPVAAAASAPTTATGQPEPSSLRGKTEKLSRLRKVIAARMVESLQTSAQLTTVVEVDVTAISRLRHEVKAGFEAREGVKLSFLAFFAKAAIDALKSYPQVNASIDTAAGEVTYHDGEHLGVAVDTERGLLVPVIKDAGDLSIAGLARKIADLAARTRDNKIGPDELSGGTFTLTNTGSRGALFDTPIINQPQVAILGTGTVVKRPVVIDDANLGETIAVRQMVYLALTYDHRLVDGADAARFLTTIKQRLEEAKFQSELGL